MFWQKAFCSDLSFLGFLEADIETQVWKGPWRMAEMQVETEAQRLVMHHLERILVGSGNLQAALKKINNTHNFV